MGNSPRKIQLLITFNLFLSVCSALVAVYSLFDTSMQGMLIMAGIFLAFVATAFFLASRALQRGWRGVWYWQLVGPVILVFVVFGALAAVVFGVVGAIACARLPPPEGLNQGKSS